MDRSAQLTGQIFIYIMAAVVVGAVVLIGYAAISNLLEDQCELEQVTFKSSLAKLLPKYKDFGRVKTEEFTAPCGATSVCFVDATQIGNTGFEADNFFIENSVQDGQELNVFLVGETTTGIDYYDYLRTVDGKTVCADVQGGRFQVVFRGQGRTLLVTE